MQPLAGRKRASSGLEQ